MSISAGCGRPGVHHSAASPPTLPAISSLPEEISREDQREEQSRIGRHSVLEGRTFSAHSDMSVQVLMWHDE